MINKKNCWGLIFIIAIAFSIYHTGILQDNIFNINGLSQFRQFFIASLQPDLTPEFLQLTFQATITTLAYAVCGTFISLTLGLIPGIFTSKIWWLTILPKIPQTKTLWLFIRAILAFPRAIHEMIWGLFFVSIWGLDPLVAIMAIAIPFGAIVTKVFSEIIDETPKQPLLTLINSGISPLTAFLYTIIPQAFLNLLSYSFYRFECSLRSAAILGIIGAGGLGYEIFLSLQSLRYSQLWTLFYALVILNGTVDISSALLRKRLGCASRLDLNLKTKKLSKFQKINKIQRDYLIIFFIVLILILIPFCFWYIQPDFTKLWSSRTWELLKNIGQQSFPPNFDVAEKLFPLSLQTLEMSILAITIAGIGGIILSFSAAQNFAQHQFILIFTRIFLLFCRAIPAPIWALVFLFILFPGVLPGAIALGLHNLGILGRLMAEVNENVEKPPLEALQAQGIAPNLVFLYGVLPLTMPRFLAYIFYRWEVCMRETIIVGLVGAGGLGRLLTEQLSSFDYAAVIVTLACFIILTFLVDWVSSLARS